MRKYAIEFGIIAIGVLVVVASALVQHDMCAKQPHSFIKVAGLNGLTNLEVKNDANKLVCKELKEP